jgi:rubrerythrin
LAAHIDERELNEREEARKILRDQIMIEGELIGLYEKSVQEIPNVLVQQMLRLIRHDSQKHVMMLGVVLDFLEGKEVFMQDRVGLADSLKRHLELEKESIQKGELLLKQGWLRDRKGYRTIIESWVEDEKKHHRVLKDLSDKPYTPINSDDFSAAFRDEAFFEERYRRSKAYWEKTKETGQ